MKPGDTKVSNVVGEGFASLDKEVRWPWEGVEGVLGTRKNKYRHPETELSLSWRRHRKQASADEGEGRLWITV